jgi:hypothetical protein
METLSVIVGGGRACQEFDVTVLSKGDCPVNGFFDGKTKLSTPLKPQEEREGIVCAESTDAPMWSVTVCGSSSIRHSWEMSGQP